MPSTQSAGAIDDPVICLKVSTTSRQYGDVLQVTPRQPWTANQTQMPSSCTRPNIGQWTFSYSAWHWLCETVCQWNTKTLLFQQMFVSNLNFSSKFRQTLHFILHFVLKTTHHLCEWSSYSFA